MKYRLRLSGDNFKTGSLVTCLLNAYGIYEFTITNHYGFCWTFNYKGDDDEEYDNYFFHKIKIILTERELNSFKKRIRTFLDS